MLIPALFFALGAALGAVVALVLWMRDRQALVAETARLAAERNSAVDAVNAQRAEVAETQVQLREAFAALSRSALKENRDDFMHNAESLISPVKETLARVQQHLSDVDKSREGSFQAVRTELGSLRQTQELLRTTTEGLSRSLGSPNVRGAWGEIQLKRIVELAGMLAQCDFIEKVSTSSDSGARQTPDLVIKLPGDATIVVDSKVPISAYRSAVNAADTVSRDAFLTQHVRQVRDHMKALGAKDYWKQFQPAPDFVIMFLPLEPLLPAAFERDDALFDLSASLRVIPATPMTLLALLKAIAMGWKQQQLAQNAEEIQGLGRDLYERLAGMVEHLEGVGRNIKQAGDSYDKLVGSLESKVLPGARRFKELGVTSTRDIADIDPLRLEVRPIVKPELTGNRPDDEREAPARRTGNASAQLLKFDGQ